MTTTSRTLRAQLRAELDFARSMVHAVLEDFPEDRVTFRATPADNHVLWTVGHLACTDLWALTMLGVDVDGLPDAWAGLFGYQSTLLDDPAGYPEFADVRAHFERARATLNAWLDGASDADLLRPIDDGGMDFAKDAAEALGKCAWHEGWHAGQLSTLRRAAGLPPAFGA
jgi:hypothetical protein